jgi:C-terminal processing protease CtpA/Prc
MLEEIDVSKIENIIVDLRSNKGGNDKVTEPLIKFILELNIKPIIYQMKKRL